MIQPLRFVQLMALSGALLASGMAHAAPQVLGLVASVRPTPMTCGISGCQAELSSFCLQQPRPHPANGTAYRPAPGTMITLVVAGRDGQVRRLNAAPYLAYLDSRSFASVTAWLPATAFAGLRAASIAIYVGKDASLLPEINAADPSPQTRQEIALAIGVDRRMAGPIFDASGSDSDAIRLTNAMINYLPPGELGVNPVDGGVLARTQADYVGVAIDPAGMRQAEEIHDDCAAKVDVTHQISSMRSCLEGSHDILLTHMNVDLWNLLGGS